MNLTEQLCFPLGIKKIKSITITCVLKMQWRVKPLPMTASSPTRVPAQVPAALLILLLPTNVFGEVEGDSQVIMFCYPQETQSSGFPSLARLIQPGPFWPSEEWTSEWKVSFFVSFRLSEREKERENLTDFSEHWHSDSTLPRQLLLKWEMVLNVSIGMQKLISKYCYTSDYQGRISNFCFIKDLENEQKVLCAMTN